MKGAMCFELFVLLLENQRVFLIVCVTLIKR